MVVNKKKILKCTFLKLSSSRVARVFDVAVIDRIKGVDRMTITVLLLATERRNVV